MSGRKIATGGCVDPAGAMMTSSLPSNARRVPGPAARSPPVCSRSTQDAAAEINMCAGAPASICLARLELAAKEKRGAGPRPVFAYAAATRSRTAPVLAAANTVTGGASCLQKDRHPAQNRARTGRRAPEFIRTGFREKHEISNTFSFGAALPARPGIRLPEKGRRFLIVSACDPIARMSAS